MGVKRYIADADTTITNAFKSNLTTRGTGSNMGRADSCEIFSIYGQEASGSTELSRMLVRFPLDVVNADRTNGVIPNSGSVKFYLRAFNATTPFTLPRDFTLQIAAVTGSDAATNTALSGWQEGNGIDMDEYTDVTRNGIGTNWGNRGSSSTGLATWTTIGGDFHSDTSSSFTAKFNNGNEDLELDVTTLVEQWLNSSGNVLGHKRNYGIGIYLTGSQEAFFSSSAGVGQVSGSVLDNRSGSTRSYYTKKFFARSSEFFFKRPSLEARWNSAWKDDRGNFYYSSSLATSTENLNTLYLYNYFRGQLRNIPSIGTGLLYLQIFSGSADNSKPTGSALVLSTDGTHVASGAPTIITGGWSATGIYTASFALAAAATPLTNLFDVWYSGSGAAAIGPDLHTGSIEPTVLRLSPQNTSTRFVTSVTNLKPAYSTNETARFRVFARQKDWNPSIYTKATAVISPFVIESGSYAVTRIVDDLNAVQFGTGSDLHTQMSFDVSGSYFDLDMGLLEGGYSYKIKFAYYNGSIGDWQEQPEEFKFRVESP